MNSPATSVARLRIHRSAIIVWLLFAEKTLKAIFGVLQHGVIPGSSQTKAEESALQERMRPASCGLATMESGNGILCRTGRAEDHLRADQLPDAHRPSRHRRSIGRPC